MKFTIEVNLEGKDTNDLFNISEDRAVEITKEINIVLNEMAGNYKQYSFDRQVENSIKMGIHKGKILARLLQIVKTPQEQVLIIAITHDCIEIVKKIILGKRIIATL